MADGFRWADNLIRPIPFGSAQALSDGPTPMKNGGVIAFIDAPEGYEVELIQKPK